MTSPLVSTAWLAERLSAPDIRIVDASWTYVVYILAGCYSVLKPAYHYVAIIIKQRIGNV